MSNNPDQSDPTPTKAMMASDDVLNVAQNDALSKDLDEPEKLAPDPPTNMHSVMRLPLYVLGGFLALILVMGFSLFMVWYNAYQETAQIYKGSQKNSQNSVEATSGPLTPAAPIASPQNILAIDALKQEIAAIKSAQGSQTPYGSAGVDLLLGRIEKLELKLSRSQASLEALQALNQLSQATQTGASYEAQLVLARAKIMNIPIALSTQAALLKRLDGLSLKAKSGIPSRTLLVMGFSQQARSAFVAAPLKGEKPGLGKEINHWLRQNVTIRRIDRQDESDAASLIHAAELKVHNGDLEGAMPLISKLPDSSKLALKPWTDQAMARIEADSLVQNLSQAIEAAVLEDSDRLNISPTIAKPEGVTP